MKECNKCCIKKLDLYFSINIRNIAGRVGFCVAETLSGPKSLHKPKRPFLSCQGQETPTGVCALAQGSVTFVVLFRGVIVKKSFDGR